MGRLQREQHRVRVQRQRAFVGDGRTLYHNAFVTNHALADDTVEPLVAAGRTRSAILNLNEEQASPDAVLG